MSLLRRPHDHHRSFRWSALAPVSRPQARRLITRKLSLYLAKSNHAAVLMATTIPCKIHIPFRLPRPLNPTKPPASKTARPANCELVDGRADPSTYPPLLSLKSAAATRPNLHSLNSWPAVQCNEGFCNASEGQRLPLTTTMASQKPHHYANAAST